MTYKELSQLYYLNLEIKSDFERLERLEAQIGKTPAGVPSGMPHNNSGASSTEELAVRIITLKEKLSNNQLKAVEEQQRLMDYINSVSDSYIRTIFKYRFIDNLKWHKIGPKMHTTGDSVKQQCYRYIQKNSEK